MVCTCCDWEIVRVNSAGLCSACQLYFENGGTINPLPEPGTITYDYRGYVVCHICGKAYKRLGTHAKQFHNMTIKEYKERFGLCNNARTTEANYSRMMSNYAYQYNMPEQLRITGADTRIKPGDTHLRLGKQVRLQEKMRLSRMSHENKIRRMMQGGERV